MAAVLDFGSIISHLDERMQITIYTDGACDIHADNQPGGWAAILRAADESGALVKETVLSGGAESTTNNQMELTAVIEGIKALKMQAEVTIFTDSRYVIDIARKAKRAKLNRALWQAFFDIAGPHQIDWRFVKGHAGDALNERCDRLAVAEKNRRAKPQRGQAAESAPTEETAIMIYLSTSFSGKTKTTAWAAVITVDGKAKELSGRLLATTELEGTLIGAIKCLESLPEDQAVTLFTAQEYLSKGMTLWLPGWQKKKWKTRNGESVRYRKHWQTLLRLSSERKIFFKFVKKRGDIEAFQRGKALASEILKRD